MHMIQIREKNTNNIIAAFSYQLDAINYLKKDLNTSNLYFIVEYNGKKYNPQIKFYGYTKRLDMIPQIKDLLTLSNVYVNSDLKKIYDLNNANHYKINTNIKKYYNNSNKCGGVCSGCGLCYTLKNAQINTFIHAAPAHLQKIINTNKNKAFLIELINKKLNLNTTLKDIGGGFFVNSFLELLNNNGVTTPTTTTNKQKIKTVPDLLKFIDLRGLNNE